MKFPHSETKIQALAYSLGSGLAVHGSDFTSIDPGPLDMANSEYLGSITAVEDAKATYRQAVINKNRKLENLKDVMKNNFKQAEIDAWSSPGNLYEIGWSPRAIPTPQTPPEQAHNFTAVDQGPGTITFNWAKATSGDKATNYLIERRIGAPINESGQFGSWQQVYTSFVTDAKLNSQPRGVQLEYRVIATNPAGQAIPSNTAAATL